MINISIASEIMPLGFNGRRTARKQPSLTIQKLQSHRIFVPETGIENPRIHFSPKNFFIRYPKDEPNYSKLVLNQNPKNSDVKMIKTNIKTLASINPPVNLVGTDMRNSNEDILLDQVPANNILISTEKIMSNPHVVKPKTNLDLKSVTADNINLITTTTQKNLPTGMIKPTSEPTIIGFTQKPQMNNVITTPNTKIEPKTMPTNLFADGFHLDIANEIFPELSAVMKTFQILNESPKRRLFDPDFVEESKNRILSVFPLSRKIISATAKLDGRPPSPRSLREIDLYERIIPIVFDFIRDLGIIQRDFGLV